MPTQKGMNFFTGWKRQAGEPMKEKKDRERFSIKFNENDPAHDAVIRLLEKQGPHSKAQFIVNAVLHYINCSETPDAAVPWIADRAAIEEIVAEILGRAGAVKQSGHGTGVKKRRTAEQETVKPEQKKDGEQTQKEMDQATLSLIADTMSAFRGS